MTTRITSENITDATITATDLAAGAGSTDWQAVIVADGSTVTTMATGKGYFVNTTSAVGIVKLPASASRGDYVEIKDYAGTFGTNKLTIQRNSHNIQGVANDSDIKTNRASVQLVYIDATKGWLYTNESNIAELGQELYVTATGGTVSTVATNYKVHVFTGDGNFVVSCAGNTVGNNKVDYLVVAGGGSGGIGSPGDGGGGAGAGGYRESYTPAVSGPYTASPLKSACGALTVTAQTYPVTVGGGAATPGSNCSLGAKGSDSIFSTITSTGGGGGDANGNPSPAHVAATVGSGGSGGGGHQSVGGSGNTPPVSPPQGNDGASGAQPTGTPSGAGGGGAGGAGNPNAGTWNPGPNDAGEGGAGTTSHITGSPVARAGGGGGGNAPGRPNTGAPGPGGSGGGGAGQGPSAAGSGGANTGGGGGGSGPGNSGAGGKGVVVIRYKFQ